MEKRIFGRAVAGKIIALISYMTQILLSIIVFANVIVVFTKALASVQRVKEVLDAEPSIKDDDATYQNGDEAATAVEFTDVSYAFPNPTKTPCQTSALQPRRAKR